MNGKDRDRSFSEVGDTLRYFNSMSSSHSWCCTEYDYDGDLVVDLNKVDMPLDGAAMATAAAKAVAVAAAVSSFDSFEDEVSTSEAGNAEDNAGIIFMREPNNSQSQRLLSPPLLPANPMPNHGNLINSKSAPAQPNAKSVAILLTTPNEAVEAVNVSAEAALPITSLSEEKILNSDRFNAQLRPSLSPVLRRASDEYPTNCTRKNQLLQVVNVIDNPLLGREASDGVQALREDLEKQRRHSICPGNHNQCHRGSKTLTESLREWITQMSSENHSLASSTHGMNDTSESGSALASGLKSPRPSLSTSFTNKLRLNRVEVPEVVVSHHTSPNEMLEDAEELAQRDLMAQKVQEFLILGPRTPIKDKLFTAGLIFLTMIGILVLFWYQNFGPGFRAFKPKPGGLGEEASHAVSDYELNPPLML